MSNSIWEILAGTPWWVYVVFFYLLRIGYSATKPRIVPINKLLILPLIFVPLSIASLYTTLGLTFFHASIWCLALLLGAGLGWLQFTALKIKAVKNEAKLYIPGTWSIFVIILSIFAVKYFSGYELAVNPQLFAQTKYAVLFLFLYGLFAGIFVGRFAYAFRCVRVGPYATV